MASPHLPITSSDPYAVKSPGVYSLEAELADVARAQNRVRDPRAVTSALLYLDNITVSFDGFRALNALSLAIDEAEMRAIIGPNGAGKTTMMDVITGKTRPNQGVALFAGVNDLTSLDEAAIAQLGIGRKFQTPTVFDMHTVEDNLLLAIKESRAPFANFYWQRTPFERERTDELLERIRMTDHRKRSASELSHGQKQWLEIGMLLMQDPELLMLDEPIAGMSARERELTADLLKRICQNRSVIVIEHDMDFVARIAHKVTVMHQGKILAEGSMDKVQSDPKVIDVYLGH